MEGVDVVDERRGNKRSGRMVGERKGSKKWILKKKEQMERKGKVVKASSKYTGFVHVRDLYGHRLLISSMQA